MGMEEIGDVGKGCTLAANTIKFQRMPGNDNEKIKHFKFNKDDKITEEKE